MSSSNQRPANRGFRSVLRCAITYYRQSPLAVCTRTIKCRCCIDRLIRHTLSDSEKPL